VTLFRQSLATLSELGARQDVARLLAEMGHSVLALGNEDEAKRLFYQALHIAIETHGTFIALEALVGLATLQAQQRELAQALELLLIVLQHPASIQDTKQRAEQRQHEVEAQLTKVQIEAIQARMQAKSFATVVDEILNHSRSWPLPVSLAEM
jgi:phosphate starvation-inducible protein PhoH